MNKNEHEQLVSQLAGLNELLAITPDSAVIDRLSLEYRKSQIEEQLRLNPPPPHWPINAVVTFSGNPVIESQGIVADFGIEAMKGFSDLIICLADAFGNGQGSLLGNSKQVSNQFLITDVARGSFGFKVEEVLDQQTSFLTDESPVEAAIGRAKGIFEALAGDDEEALAEAIADIDSKGLNDLRGFLKLLVDKQAMFSLSFKEDTFHFNDVHEVQRGLTNLGQENLSENELQLVGYFQGFLPKVRRAEFVRSDTGEVISTRVNKEVTRLESINDILNQPVTVRASSRQVGNSRPRYTILGLNPAQGS